MQSKFAKASAIASLLLNSAAAIDDHSDGLGGDAPCIESYAVVEASEDVGGDPHLCHGLLSGDDGSVVGVGSSLTKGENFGSGDGYQGVIIRTNSGCTYDDTDNYYDRFPILETSGSGCKKYKWVTKLGSGNARANWVAESADNSYYIAVGVEQQSGNDKSRMVIWKIDASDGSEIWKMNYGTSGEVTGLESVAFDADGNVIVGGFTNSEGDMKDQYFKSGGQITEGKPFIAMITASDADGSSKPTSFDWTYTMSGSDYNGSCKALRIDSGKNIYAVVGQKSAAVKLAQDGSEVWKTGMLDDQAQMNDLEVNSDGSVALTGHQYGLQEEGCWFSGCGTISGMIIKLDANGDLDWQKTYGNYPNGVNQFADSGEGNWALIYNECWGIAPTYDSNQDHDGYVLACGTGIEGCPLTANFKPGLYFECQNDPRTTWRALTIATDLNGKRVWSRMDSFQSADEPVGSASEYVLSHTDGSVTFITDEAIGFGFVQLTAPDGEKCDDVVTGEGAFKLSASAFLAISALYISL